MDCEVGEDFVVEIDFGGGEIFDEVVVVDIGGVVGSV